MHHAFFNVLVLLFGLALVGGSIAQFVSQGESLGLQVDMQTDAAKWRDFLIYGLAPLFAGVAVALYAVYRLYKNKDKYGRAKSDAMIGTGMDMSSA